MFAIADPGYGSFSASLRVGRGPGVNQEDHEGVVEYLQQKKITLADLLEVMLQDENTEAA